MTDILESIPSAQEAAQKARGVDLVRTEVEIHRVAAALARAIERGEASVVIEPPFTSLILIDDLKQKGYSVRQCQTGPMESGTEISW